MGKATAITTLKEDKDVPNSCRSHHKVGKKHCLYCAHRADKLNPLPSLEKTPSFTIWGSLLVRYVIIHPLKEMKLNHSRYSTLTRSLAFCCLHFALCHTLPHSSSSPSQRNLKRLCILHDPLVTCFFFLKNTVFHHLF